MELQKHVAAFVNYVLQDTKFPKELTDMVASSIGVVDVARLALLSREANRLADPVVYHELRIRLVSPTSREDCMSALPHVAVGSPLVQLVRTLVRSQSKAAQVRHVCFLDFPTPDIEVRAWFAETQLNLEDFTAAEAHFYEETVAFGLSSSRPIGDLVWNTSEYRDSRATVAGLAMLLMRLVAHLETLTVGMAWLKWKTLRDALHLFIKPDHMNQLRRLQICPKISCDLRMDSVQIMFDTWTRLLACSFSLPSISFVETVISTDDQRRKQPSCVPVSTAPHIRTLILHHIDDGDADALSSHQQVLMALQGASGLRRLEYHLWTDLPAHEERDCWSELEYSSFRYGQLLEVLQLTDSTLEELILSERIVEFDSESYFEWGTGGVSIPAFTQDIGLVSLLTLRRLQIPYPWLFGWSKEIWERAERRPWGEVLPSSLRHLTLTDHLSELHYFGDWTEDDLMLIIGGILEWLVSLAEDRSELRFGLLLKRAREMWVASERAELQAICSRYGIACEIVKENPDVL